ncbi:hypothetical protein CspeluHIS016_0900900 [Cutaneotrichosporon spelunceum]|uniref:Ser-Thr-rich glycosyl-phosphatidyl-inositol-anchored membrane family-domain-containing protein n=1 Tax=Cutaneotrichosporon spelunceum TaxID=1672016 RepID=A0AAD3YF72_9TREE|nr:hypothetical protein CspeluHIS016_0900900 [Cutaneotrichosporon spelunceum]
MLKALAVVVLAVSAAAQAAFSITTPPALVTCQPSKLSWTGGAPPYILSIIPGGQPGAAVIKDIDTNLNVMQYTWNTDVVGGTHLTFKIVDKDGNIAYSAPITVQAGSSDECLKPGATKPPQPSAPAATGAAPADASGSSGAAGSGSTKAPAASATPSGSAAFAPVAPVAAAVAVAGAALLF